MIDVSIAATGFCLLILMMALGFHVAVAMFAVSIAGAVAYLGVPAALEYGTQLWGAGNNFVLTAIPLFVLLGEILVRGGFTDKMYRSLADWLYWLPGGLLHTNIVASGMLAAVSGSSVATAATIGTIAIPALEHRKYDQRMVLGSIAAGATLGILIPPSINLILYGAMTGNSVGKLYLAGIIPGILLALLFMGVIVVWGLRSPGMGREAETIDPLGVRLRRLKDLLPPVVIFTLVMGSIYLGWATPTESAALAVVGAFFLTALAGRLSFKMLHECFERTILITAMILLITSAAFYLTFVLGLMGVPEIMADFVTRLNASPSSLILALTIFYLILGCFFDALAMIVGTIPIVYPMTMAVGIDPIWFGIFLVLMAELALITPPMGMNLYVVQGVRKEGSISTVIVGTLPFLVVMLLFVFLVFAFPFLVTWLPEVAF